MRLSFVIVVLFFLVAVLKGQEGDKYIPGVSSKQVQRMLPESQWRYARTVHQASGQVLHEAGDGYNHLVYFQFDHLFQSSLNGVSGQGIWQLNGDILHWSFRDVQAYRIIHIDHERLVLEFEPYRGNGFQEYHFVALPEAESPFARDKHLLPTVKVEREHGRSERSETGFFTRIWRWIFPEKKESSESLVSMRIEMMGGGYYGGIDPVIKDFITIESDGRLIREFQSKYQPLVRTVKDIPREELEALVMYARDEGFFEWPNYYGCETALCDRRSKKKPKPIPLQLAITLDGERKVVMLRVWGKEKGVVRWIDYPPALDEIVRSIQRLAHRLETDS